MDRNASEGRRGFFERWRFAPVLLIFILIFAVVPFLTGPWVRYVLQGLFFLLSVSLIVAFSREKRLFWLALSLLLPALLLEVASEIAVLPLALDILRRVFNLAFLLLTLTTMFVGTFRSVRLDTDKLFGVVTIYFMLGFAWANLFQIVYLLDPSSFKIAPAFLDFDLIYFSFVTLTTVGYGDVVALSPGARSLALLEAITGQIYLAVLVARIVGLYIAQESGQGDPKPTSS